MISLGRSCLRTRVADPHDFNADRDPHLGPSFQFSADPDQTFHRKADLDPAPHQSDAHQLPMVSNLVLRASTLSAHGPPWLHFVPLELLNFDLMRIRVGFPK
jgi:hypothetical protein